MDSSKPAALGLIVRRVLEESAQRAHRISELRNVIAAGTYKVSAVHLAEALLHSLRN